MRIPYDLEKIDIETDNIKVFVQTEDGFPYHLAFLTANNIEFWMKNKKIHYSMPAIAFC